MPAISIRVLWNSQWRLFLQKSFWAEAWRTLKRVHKDRRARRRLLAMAGFAGLLFGLTVVFLVYVTVLVGSEILFLIPLLVLLVWWLGHDTGSDCEGVSLAPRIEVEMEARAHQPPPEISRYFQDLTILYAVLVERAGSERFLKESRLPAGMEIKVRRKHLELLRSLGVWDRLIAADREILMMPDGTWESELIGRTSMGLEPLRLLRWLLRVDIWLPSIGQNLYGTYTSAHEVMAQPARIYEQRRLADLPLIRAECDEAALFRLRCRAEEISRGYLKPESEQVARWALDISEELNGDQDEDLVVAEKLVSEVDPRELSWAWALATMRVEFLEHVLSVLQRGAPPDTPLASVFARSHAQV